MISDLNVSVADEIGPVEYGVSTDVDATSWSNDERRAIELEKCTKAESRQAPCACRDSG